MHHTCLVIASLPKAGGAIQFAGLFRHSVSRNDNVGNGVIGLSL